MLPIKKQKKTVQMFLSSRNPHLISEAISKSFESELGITSSMRSESIYDRHECVLKPSLLDPIGSQSLVQEDKG